MIGLWAKAAWIPIKKIIIFFIIFIGLNILRFKSKEK
jgi:hypothetical protein